MLAKGTTALVTGGSGGIGSALVRMLAGTGVHAIALSNDREKLALLDGTQDGDALFFNRVISISGRTEAVLALRNAIEDAELTPADLMGLSGTLGRLADAGILGGLDVARRFAAASAAPAAAEQRS